MAREYSDFLDEVQPIAALTPSDLEDAYARARREVDEAEAMRQAAVERHDREITRITAWRDRLAAERTRRGIGGAE